MDIHLNKHNKDFEGAAIVPVYSDNKKINIDYITDKKNSAFVMSMVDKFDGEDRSAKLVNLPEAEQYGKFSVILLGLGEKKKFNIKKFVLAIRRAVVAAKSEKIKNIAISLPDFILKNDTDGLIKLTATNLLMADYDFNKYKEVPKTGWPKIDNIYLFTKGMKSTKSSEKSLAEGIIIGEEVNYCRDLANTPGADMTPKVLADSAIAEAKKNGMKIKILEVEEMAKLGMGGVLGVGGGSPDKPKFIIIEYWGAGNKPFDKAQGKPLVFAGKGVTFDSGGLNLKPSEHIYEMHMDMSGGAATIHALSAIARAKLKVNVIGLIPAVENVVSGSSYRPGDLLKTITGKTIEVLNTDAEGRVILADALGYAIRYNPELVVDVATLTGAAAVALGQRAIALFANNEKLEKNIREIGDDNVEPVWPLPLWDEYVDEIKGTFADFANIGKTRYGGAITAAVFLKQFIGDYPWAHLDIAPTMTTIEGQYLAKGASGTGVRILYELAKKYSK